MDNTTRELIQLAASWAAGCSDCLETHWNALKRAGVSEEDIQESLDLARAIRVKALLNMDSLVRTLNQRLDIPVVAGSSGCCGPDCGCSEG
ncbi:MAG: carboxymuconolactone decarboxylase family protein [Firmicutes bacterium]|nr:carboxymuconolactone decarboxylase family protein [Bacillota bacterium]